MKNKPLRIAFLSTFISLLPLQIASAQAANETPHIEVSGQGLVEAEPELLRWDIEVENRGPDIVQLAEVHASEVARILKAIEKLGVSKDRIQTSWPKLSEHYTRKNNSNVKDGYEASTRIAFELTDINQYDAVWRDLSKFESLRIRNSTWGLDHETLAQIQAKARLKAIEDARLKAIEMAGALGMEVRSPLRISESHGARPYPMADAMVLSAAPRNGGSGPAHAAGMLAVRAEVTIVFAIHAAELEH